MRSPLWHLNSFWVAYKLCQLCCPSIWTRALTPTPCRNFREPPTLTVVSPHSPQRYNLHRGAKSQSLQSFHTSRMGAPVLHATLLLLSAFLALTQTKNQSFAGECGSGGKQPLPGGARAMGAPGRTREAASSSHLQARLSSSLLYPRFGARCSELLSAHAPTGDPRKSSAFHSSLVLSAGSHSRQYLVTATTSRPGLRDPHVFIVGYVDHMPFMRFDSDGVAQRIQARGPWVKQMGPEYLEMERKNAERYSHRARENLRFAIQVYNQSDKGEWPLHISRE